MTEIVTIDYEILKMQQRVLWGMETGSVYWADKKSATNMALWLSYDGLKARNDGIEIFRNDKKWNSILEGGDKK